MIWCGKSANTVLATLGIYIKSSTINTPKGLPLIPFDSQTIDLLNDRKEKDKKDEVRDEGRNENNSKVLSIVDLKQS